MFDKREPAAVRTKFRAAAGELQRRLGYESRAEMLVQHFHGDLELMLRFVDAEVDDFEERKDFLRTGQLILAC